MMIYRILGVLILLIFYGCYFLKMILQARKGIQTDQIGKGKQGTERTIELVMKAVTLLVPLVEAYCIFTDRSALPEGYRIIGCVIGFIGDVVFMISVYTMKDSWRAGVPEKDQTDLVTDGIYRYSRNPAFLGFDLVYLGILMMFFGWLLSVVSLIAAVMFHLQIVYVEEKFLTKVFGDDYIAYTKQVNRYLGRKG